MGILQLWTISFHAADSNKAKETPINELSLLDIMCHFMEFPYPPNSDAANYKGEYFDMESKAQPWRGKIVMETFLDCTGPMQVPMEEEEEEEEEEVSSRPCATGCRGCW